MSIKYKDIPVIEMDRIIKRIEKSDKCWNWIGVVTLDGYGTVYIKGKIYQAHRVVYSIYKKLNNMLVIDHLCKNRKCVNPDHLREVTIAINTIENSDSLGAINKLKKNCKHGHVFDFKNTYICKYGKRKCRACSVIRIRNLRNRRKNCQLN